MAIPIFINRIKYDAPSHQMTGRQILALAGLGEDHDLFRLQGEGDRTGGIPVGLDESVDVKEGEHFRAIPGNRNFGFSDAPAQLLGDIDSLRADGYTVELVQDGVRFYVIFKDFSMPGYDPSVVDLMLMTDYQYPQSKMDMFWTCPRVQCVSGSTPQSADSTEQYCGRSWQRWSWHYPTWDPAHHNVRTQLDVVLDRIAKGN